tara:strand:+ start:403 stop:642 length:240 start_codon:yes stop_codon:yes gene_type:complete
MTAHHVSLYHPETNPAEGTVLKQDLVTYQQTGSCLKITTLERSFSSNDHFDSYTSVTLLLRSLPEPEGLLWGAIPKQEA